MKTNTNISGDNLMRAVLCIAIVIVASSTAAVGQTLDRGQRNTPEQMIEDAIKKIDEGNFTEATKLFETARRIRPDLIRLKLVQGLVLIETGRAVEAITKLEEFNKSADAGNEYRGFAAIGRIYLASRMFRQAVRPLERAKDYAPIEANGRFIRAEILIDLATAHQRLSRMKDALKYADEAANLAPNDPAIQLKLGRMHKESQDYVAALRAVDRAVTLIRGQLRTDPFKPERNAELKMCNDLRVEVLQAQRAGNPDDPEIYHQLAVEMAAQADAERRIKLLTAREYALEALNKNPRLTACRIFLARIEWALGGSQDALDRLKKVLEEDPSNAEAAQLRREIEASFQSAASP